ARAWATGARQLADSCMSGERSARLEAVAVSVTRTPPTVRSMTLTDVARSGDLATTGCPKSARIRKSRADMAHADVGGVSLPAVWSRKDEAARMAAAAAVGLRQC